MVLHNSRENDPATNCSASTMFSISRTVICQAPRSTDCWPEQPAKSMARLARSPLARNWLITREKRFC